MSSCTKESSSDIEDSSVDKEESCLPFIENNSLLQDMATIPVDPGTMIVSHRQEGDCLVLDTRFGGGCEEHILELFIDVEGSDALNLNQSLSAILSHDNTDPCEAIVAYEVKVDISELKELNLDDIFININGYSELISITF